MTETPFFGLFKSSKLLANRQQKHSSTDYRQRYTTAATSSCSPHHPHPLSQFYAIHCRPISSVDMTREESQGQSRKNQSLFLPRQLLNCMNQLQRLAAMCGGSTGQ